MLQKIVVVIVGLVMSVVGALTPDALFASNTGGTSGLSADTTEEMLSTIRSSDGQAFARVSVLWVEVDGRRVTEDAWGTGEVDEMRFKVGVKGVEDAALAVGDRVVDLHPTDIITVRMFRGDFSYRGVGTGLATVQLQGTVKTTVLKEGDITNRVMTSPGELDLNGVGERRGGVKDESKVAYVVLTTGEKVDTVAVEDGGARLYTQEAATAAEATTEAGNLLAKWVKIDNKLVREYTWGDGVLKRIEFEPAEAATRSVVLTYNDDVAEVAAGERVVIEDFVGEYLIYQVSGGMTRVRLDGYSASFKLGSDIDLPTIGGGAPAADFTWAPLSPKTTDTVRFTSEVRDEGGLIVFRQWDFGDGSNMVALEQPTHRFAEPGVYEVALTVTDNDLQNTTVRHTIVVRNAEPVPDFDFSPKVVTTRTMVAFSDLSFDNDGKITSYEWDFGDGSTETKRNPSHNFTSGGTYTVTLTTTDDKGARASISKVISVRNAPPIASFSFSTANNTPPTTLEPIQFLDTSEDTDGTVVRWNWSFGDGAFGSGSAPTHQYEKPGVYNVRLTAFDDQDDADTASTNIIVHNRAPFADFVWAPGIESPANVPVTFTSTSQDPDGTVLVHLWDFGDGTQDVRGATVTHTFPRAGTYHVKLTVTDNTLGTSNVTKEVNVSNSAPHANFRVSANPGYRGAQLVFSDASRDPDGDAIVNWTWDLGDGSSAYGKVVSYAYASTGTKTVNLTVRDSAGTEATVARPVRILNRPPTILASFSPAAPAAGDNITFTAEGIDPDVPGGPVTFQWGFSDGHVDTGDTVVKNFSKAGNYSVVVHGRDSDGGVSAPTILMVRVGHGLPKVDFALSPPIPIRDREVNFTAIVTPAGDAKITTYRWDFGFDASSTANTRNATFVYARNGTFPVTLEVVDDKGMVNSTTKEVFVNIAPVAAFAIPEGGVRLNIPFTLTDLSDDEDGDIVSWHWDFGDGTNATGIPPPSHTFTTSGSYPITLTVTDDMGATSSATKVIEIANRPPLAVWTVFADPMERLVPFQFDGSPSSDPDGQPIASYAWNFGDGTGIFAGQQVSHTFEHSGFKLVNLTVKDVGGRTSLRTPDSHQSIRIGANHEVTVHVTATFPDGREADLSDPAFTVTARLNNVLIPSERVQPNGKGYDVLIPKEDWLHELSSVQVTIAADFLAQTSRSESQSVQLRDDQRVVELPFELDLRLSPIIVPGPGDQNLTLGNVDVTSLLSLLGGGDQTSAGDPIYRNPLERPNGTGFLRYSDGMPAGLESVRIEARYVPLNALRPVRDMQQVSDSTDGGILGWCPVAQTVTRLDGSFDWVFDGATACVTNGVAGGVYPVGRWEVRARALADFDNPSPPRALYYDPTGGTLLGVLVGLA